jgi:peptidoglycan/LPS O-acetylase OafA/YrhL
VTFQERLVLTSFRGPGFDHIRLAAATIVLLHHCWGMQNDFLMHYSRGYMDFGRFAVVIFFAVSGFLVTPGLLRAGGLVDYAVSRTLRIFPGLTVNILLSMLALGPVLTIYSVKAYFADPQTYLYAKNILTLMVNFLPGVVSRDQSPLVINGALWTLHFEVLCYMALALASALAMLKHRHCFLALWCACYATYVVISTSPAIADALPERLSVFASLFVYFGCGAALYLYRERIPFSAILACAAVGSLVVALPLGAGALFMPVCLPYVIIFCGLSDLPGKALLRHDLSYGVYLIHVPVLITLGTYLPSIRTSLIAAPIAFLVTLLSAYASWVLVESPALKRKKEVASWAHRSIESLARWLRSPAQAPGS